MPRETKKILTVSDDGSLSKLTALLEDEFEFFPLSAENPVYDALDFVPDIVVISAPSEQAAKAAEILRKTEKTAYVPAVVFSEGDDTPFLIALESDITDVFSGKLNETVLSEKIREIAAALDEGNISSYSHKLIKSMSVFSEIREPAYRGHAKRTASYAKEILKRMGGTAKEQQNIYYAGLLHDIGMAFIPETILNKKGALTDEEYERVKDHTLLGSRLLSGADEIPEVCDCIRWHHERFDGTGYPDGLMGSDIPLCARIVSAADAYDSMTSDRCYRRSLTQQELKKEFSDGSGTQFDPDVAKTFLAMINEDVNYEYRQSSEWKILFVDDDPVILKTAKFILSRFKQYKILEANSGKQALKILKDEKDIDLILLDVEMPIMNGIETLIRIRSDVLLKSIPVIFVTADGTKETLTKAMKFGVSGYITKPFQPSYFVKKITEVFNRAF